MKDLRWIIVDETKGAFIGTYNASDLGEEFDELLEAFRKGGTVTKQIGLMFAADDVYDFDRAAAFKDEEAAKGFAHWMLTFFSANPDTAKLTLRLLPLETENERFATVTEILQAGYDKYVHRMADGLYKAGTLH